MCHHVKDIHKIWLPKYKGGKSSTNLNSSHNKHEDAKMN
jgi:hypothetical protein